MGGYLPYAVLLGIGVLLLCFGVRGRRVGTEPRCGRCGYELTGSASDRCPECGTKLGVANIVIGQRVRRPKWLVAGTVLVLASSASLYVQVSDLNLYPYYPFRYLLSLAEGGDKPAFQELLARQKQRRLWATQTSRLAEACLLEQRRAANSAGFSSPWVDLLDDLDRRGALSAAQKRRYYDQILTSVRLEAPSSVRWKEVLLVSVRLQQTGPGNLGRPGGDFRVNVEQSFGIDGQVTDNWANYGCSPLRFGPPIGRGEWLLGVIADCAPGQHELAYVATFTLQRGGVRIPGWSKRVTVGAPFELVTDARDMPWYPQPDRERSSRARAASPASADPPSNGADVPP